jgi:O-methyltransferase
MSDSARLSTLYTLVRQASAMGIRGDVVECGVCNGGSAAVMAAGVVHDRERRIWLYDTFEGIPSATQIDGDLAEHFTGDFVGSESRVREVLGKVNFPIERAIFRKGLFDDTFRQPLPTAVAVLHVDGDWYESVIGSLRRFYPLLADGGFVVLDDFGHWEGARRAFYAFCREQEIEPLLERVGYTQAFWRKGEEHNRNAQPAFRSGCYHPENARD